MKKFLIGFFAVFFQLLGLGFHSVASADYGGAMLAAFINTSIAFVLFLWLFNLIRNPKTALLKFGMAFSALWGLFSLVAYVDMRGFLW